MRDGDKPVFRSTKSTHFVQRAPASRNACLPSGNLPRKLPPAPIGAKLAASCAALIRQDRGGIAVCWAIAPGDDESRSPRR